MAKNLRLELSPACITLLSLVEPKESCTTGIEVIANLPHRICRWCGKEFDSDISTRSRCNTCYDLLQAPQKMYTYEADIRNKTRNKIIHLIGLDRHQEALELCVPKKGTSVPP